MADSEPQGVPLEAAPVNNPMRPTPPRRPYAAAQGPVDEAGGFLDSLAQGIGDIFTPDDRASKMIGDMPEGVTPESPQRDESEFYSRRDVPVKPAVVEFGEVDPDVAKAANQQLAAELANLRMPGGYKLETPRRFDLERPSRELQARLKEIDERRESEAMAAARQSFQESQTRFNEALQAVEEYKPDNQGPFKTFGSKIMAGISIALGEAARGFRGGQGENIGLTLVNQTIDREVQRQRDEYNRLKDRVNFADNLYAKTFGILKNEELAEKTVKEALERRAMNLFDSATANMQGNVSQEQFRVQLVNQYRANNANLKAQGVKVAREEAIARRDAAIAESKARDLAEKKAMAGQQLSQDRKEKAQNEAIELDSAQSNVRDALVSLRKYEKTRNNKNLDSEVLSNEFRRVIANQETEGIVSFLKKNVFLDFRGDDKDLIRFSNRIKQIAFGLASQNQSSSSISNKDVGIFITLLADPLVPMKEVEGYLSFMADQLAADAVYNQAIANGFKPDEASLEADKAMTSRGYRLSKQGVFMPKGTYSARTKQVMQNRGLGGGN
jgi:hypothetical protein